MKIAVISANLGRFDLPHNENVPQSISCDYFMFTDENFPPRWNAMTPRLQAKIPKFFGWQLVPGYDYYLWIDGSATLTRSDSVQFFYNNCQGYDIVVFKHPRRPDIRQEHRYTRKGVKQKAEYLYKRYLNEQFNELYDEIKADKDFIDEALFLGGMFMYRNTSKIHQMFKEWWYFVSRYAVQDQLPFPYVLKKSGLKVHVLENHIKKDIPYISFAKHTRHSIPIDLRKTDMEI